MRGEVYNKLTWCIIIESDADILGKKKSECSYQESNLILPITSSDALLTELQETRGS